MWLQTLFNSLKSPSSRTPVRRPQRRQRLRSSRPRLEILEDRKVPSTFTVDHLADDLVGSGLIGSLRYCINQAAGGDHITFGVTGTINLAAVLPPLTHSISIDGPGANLLTVRPGPSVWVNQVFAVAANATVSITGVTVTTSAYNDGGGISNQGTLTLNNSTVSLNYGAGISNQGTLTLNNATVSHNYDVSGGAGGIFNQGGTVTLTKSTVSENTVGDYVSGHDAGGILNESGTVTLNNSTISQNSATGYGSEAGGIFNDSGTVTLNNSTVSVNAAADPWWYQADAGGIFNVGDGGTGGTLTLNNSTISGNVGDGGTGGIYDYGNFGTVHARNTIIAGNGAALFNDLSCNLGSLGHNLIGDSIGGWGFDPTDLLNVDPKLGPLQNNGGPTQTMALLPGSPALNTGDPSQLGVADQRGVVRGGGVNIGAYQASASAFVLTAPDTVTPGVPFDLTVTAVDPFGQAALGYTGTVSFGTTDGDPAVVLPAAYTFTAADQGRHTFSGGFTLITPGNQALTVTDTGMATLTGSLVITVA